MSTPKIPTSDVNPVDRHAEEDSNNDNSININDSETPPAKSKSMSSLFSRTRYSGTFLFNQAALTLPALYATLSKLWVATIDSKTVVTTDVYTYMGVVVEVLNEGLPRAAWNVIGDKSNRRLPERYALSYTLIGAQSLLGCIMSIVFVAAAKPFAGVFVPVEVRAASLAYVRLAAFSALASAVETAVAAATRALDQPDVPLVISSVKFGVNIILDMIFISRFHVPGVTPTVNTQAATQLACNLTASFVGLAYFVWTSRRKLSSGVGMEIKESARPTLAALLTLARPGFWTFTESAVRNALYLWLISGITALGSDYATAWGVFNTIRWGLIMVPIQALEATTLVFVGHAWGHWRRSVGSGSISISKPTASRRQLHTIVRPAVVSCCVALAVEIPLALFLSYYGVRRFAEYLSGSAAVAGLTEKMWKSIDWYYICYAVSTQLAAILLATRPRWYLYQSLASNLLWVLPWAIVVAKVDMDEGNAWKYHLIVFGGSLVFSLVDVVIVNLVWAWVLLKGKMTLRGLR